ncbi:conserved hypothetical protein, partial [delta proteobacterium NaphS2]
MVCNDHHLFHVVSLEGSLIDSSGKPVEEYDSIQTGQKYRLLSQARVQFASQDGERAYEAAGPGYLFVDSEGKVLLNGSIITPKPLESLLKGLTANVSSGQDLAGLPFRGILVVPDHEKRSLVYCVTGRADADNEKALAQLQESALENAKGQALSMAMKHIESNRLVKDGILKYRFLGADSDSAVSILERKDLGLENNRYRIWIKAEIPYVLSPEG